MRYFFLKKLTEALLCLKGVFLIADNIIVADCGENDIEVQKDNNRKLDELYKKCSEQRIVLNEQNKDNFQ